MQHIKVNIKEIKNSLPDNVNLVAVTKTRSIDEIRSAIDTGITMIAENKIQEATTKYNSIKKLLEKKNIAFHFIGHLQTNKVKKAVKLFDLIQSVDSIKLAQEINKQAQNISKIQNILIQVNIGKEPQKSGIYPDKAVDFIKCLDFPNIKIKGLMAIAPFIEKDKTKPYFRKMKRIFDKTTKLKQKNLDMQILSMGMSNDYQIAIEEGSNMIRIGSGIFNG